MGVIVYVESNFVLEIALGQEFAAEAEIILSDAEHGRITLVIPEFSLSEPFATVTNRERRRKRAVSEVSEIIRDLKRSQPHQSLIPQLELVAPTLAAIAQTERERLKETVRRILDAGVLLPLSGAAFRDAETYQTRHDLAPQDSIIYALILLDLQQRPYDAKKLFTSRNFKDFEQPDILSTLNSAHCSFAKDYGVARAYIQANP